MARNRYVDISIIFIGIVLFAIVLKTFQSFMRPFAIAILLTMFLMPVIRLCSKFKIPYPVILVVLVFLTFVGIYVIGTLVATEKIVFEKKLPDYQESLKESIQLFNDKTGINIELSSIKNIFSADKITKYVTTFVQGLLSLVGEFFVALMFTIFLLPFHNKTIDNLKKQLNRTKMKKFTSALSDIEKSIQNYLYIKILISLGTALVSAGILYLFRVDFVIILAVFIFILNFIPNIGSFVAVGIAISTYLLKYGIGFDVIWLLAALTLVQIIFGNILEPMIAGDRLNISPIWIIISLFVWYWIWGIVGMIMAIPLMAVIKIILSHSSSTKELSEFFS
ncbi:hypothetical protein COV93_08140 [Candidatus Woesearchaeota archaeon CG11_big_fil_rev_8_21_14_0_20_43_8]|nr:MAG: hypothetical protein COV93_08140 [Candidatus Woesearchaeota archaeon CG11_big_fil_rev_8_21_14_0_20_43_8]